MVIGDRDRQNRSVVRLDYLVDRVFIKLNTEVVDYDISILVSSDEPQMIITQSNCSRSF